MGSAECRMKRKEGAAVCSENTKTTRTCLSKTRTNVILLVMFEPEEE